MQNRKLPPRRGITGGDLPQGLEVKQVQRMGGYWYINGKFPFIHFEKERLLIFTKKGMYEVHNW
jgi:hypothetical protein